MNGRCAIERFTRGAIVGDAIGLPFEGIRGRRVRKLIGDRPLRQRLIFGRGMVSDDTEHLVMTLDAYRVARGETDAFARALATRLRLWICTIPCACGMATARACVRLTFRIPPDRSGVQSAGNGPAMRSGVLGLLAESDEHLLTLVHAATRITHTDDRAEHGAIAIALAARAASLPDNLSLIDRFERELERLLPIGSMRTEIERAIDSVRAEEPTSSFSESLGCKRGVTGFIMHTVPVVIHQWLSMPDDYERAVTEIVGLGGDTDTTAAILGGLVGLRSDPPSQWMKGILDFPLSGRFVCAFAAVCEPVGAAKAPSRIRLLVLPIRNLLFLIVVLTHALRRAAPPY